MVTKIAIIGTGPTGIYSFRRLVRHDEPFSIWLFERGEKAGIGMPYSPETATKTMLANIASIEIPPITTTYLDWLKAQPPQSLRAYGLDPDDLDARQFTPRLLLGEYFRGQFLELVRQAERQGHHVEIREQTEITDICAEDGRVRLQDASGPIGDLFDRVVLATGHVFPEAQTAMRAYFPSPWSGLIDVDIPACRVGIMGTSLSSIDAAMAVVNQHGRFLRRNGELRFLPTSKDLSITLMSRTGILPEADFYCPLPYEPLSIMTDAALADLQGKGATLDAIFDLFRTEIAAADPAYAQRVSLPDLDADSIADAYFADRAQTDPFHWARTNLEEVERNKAEKITIAWRYAILRMHEKVEELVPNLSEVDRDRFDAGLKKVFVDNYAAVPPESIRRLLALRYAGILRILALGVNYDLHRKTDRTMIRIPQAKETAAEHVFDVFIDARGQKPLMSEDLPFPALCKTLLAAGQDIPEVDAGYKLTIPETAASRIYLGALPYLMHDHPFVQGITACAEIGDAMAGDICRSAAQGDTRKRRYWL